MKRLPLGRSNACYRSHMDRDVLKLELDRNVPQLVGLLCYGKYARPAFSEDLCAVLVAHGSQQYRNKGNASGPAVDLSLGPTRSNSQLD